MKNISNNKRKFWISILCISFIASLVGILHLWRLPTSNLDVYLLIFASIYLILALISIVCIILVPGWFKIIAVLELLLSGVVIVYDLFGVALGAMQF